MKTKNFNELISSMSKCEKCLNLKKRNGRNCSLINIYQNQELAKNIPSIWTDWYNRLDSQIMIIGQDWGPYKDMEKLHYLYNKNKTKTNWKYLINQEKSNTKKMLNYYIKESSQGKYNLNNIYITNAIMCAREGNNYRGDNIDLKKSTLNCREFLLKQINILKPKVILTLGYYPLLSLSKIYNLPIAKNLTDTIKNYPEYQVNDLIIIPLYHPVAQITKSEQLKQYQKIWKYIN